MAQHQAPAGGGAADHRRVQVPLGEHAFGVGLATWLQDRQHPLLAFRQHHLVGAHARLAPRHAIEVEVDAKAALAGHLDARGREAGRAHVLDGGDRAGGHQFERRLDQQLLGEGIADLHRRALFLRVRGELGGGHGRAVDAVAAGLRAEVDNWQIGGRGGGIEDGVRLRDSDAHGVDEDVAIVTGVEVGFAADGRHADAVAVAADPGDHPFDQPPGARMGWIAKAQGVQEGDRPGAHGEDVAHDAAHSRRGALIGLDERRVVVRLHLEDHGLAIADVDNSGVLARSLDHPGRLGRELGQMAARRLVGAMLRPHHGKNAELQSVGCPAQPLQNSGEFRLAEAELHGVGQRGGGFLIHRHRS